MDKSVRSKLAIAAAVAASLTTTSSLFADAAAGGTGREFVISTGGASAFSAFTTAAGNRGPYSLGVDSMQIGGTAYTIGSGQRLGLQDKRTAPSGNGRLRAGGISASFNEPYLDDDRMVYEFHQSGSVEGIRELLENQGFITGGAALPSLPTSPNPLFVMGGQLASSSATLSNGYTWDSTTNRQPKLQLAWSDVKPQQGFAKGATTAGKDARPGTTGYGLGRANSASGFTGTNFQSFVNESIVTGGINDQTTTQVRSETVGVVAFTVSANPGTGLAKLTQDNLKFLNATGRLANGANFNFVTRDSGSGSRNEMANNIGLDPTYASGERDRKALAVTTTGFLDPLGTDVTVQIGQEQNPRRGLSGETSIPANESRISKQLRFADKTSGGGAQRPTILASRMGLGVLSTGDISTFGKSPTTATPLRILAVNFNEQGSETDGGYVQPTATNVTDGLYRMWSQEQAVTIAPYANPTANDTGVNAYKPIVGDQNDQLGGNVYNTPSLTVTSNTAINKGIVRKFLDNIKQSTILGGSVDTNQTPYDSIVAATFIPAQIMKVTKTYDGDEMISRTLTGDAATQYSTLTGGALGTSLSYADPSVQNGDVANGTQKYNVWKTTNTTATQDLSIVVNARNVLAGDFNGDSVRDIQDTAAIALAYASPAAFIATPASGDANGRNYNGVAVTSAGTANSGITVPVAGSEGLVVLSDLNSDGNIDETSNTLNVVDRTDVRYFLWGATVDTGAGTAQDRRENGVRTGELKKNTAVDTYNLTLDTFVAGTPSTGIAGFTQLQANNLKFEKRDINNSGTKAFGTGADTATNNEYKFLEDAFVLDSVIKDGAASFDYTDLDDVLSTNVDLAAANLTDDNNPVLRQADMVVMNQALTTNASANPTGRVDHTWAASTTKSGTSDIVLNAATGTFVVPAGATFTVAAGSFSAGGVADPFTQGSNHVNVVVNTTGSYGFKVTAGVKSIGSLTGTGNTQITGGTLVAQSVVLNGTVAAPTSKIDIGTNFLVIDNDTQLADVKSYVKAGRGTANGNGVYNYVGQGLTSSAIGAANGTAGFNKFAIGFVLNSDLAAAGVTLGNAGLVGYSTFGGATVDSSSILVRYTYNGDANLDGMISSLDYALLNAGFAGTLSPSLGWLAGDFTLDGLVNADDYAVLDFAKLTWGNTPLGNGDPITVPEPTSLALIALAGAGLMGRRRRNGLINA